MGHSGILVVFICISLIIDKGFPDGSVVKNLPANDANAGNEGSIPRLGRSPAEGNKQPTLVFLPGKSHGQRNLVGHIVMGLQRVGHDLATKQFLINIFLSLFTGALSSSVRCLFMCLVHFLWGCFFSYCEFS